mmetsp:Transcript_19509/g.62687  ORF Transcript_19509/g.62687 Transcript_19509/m.62687 type:complete len:222 (+) Transcript_19509:194-859(+)
MASSLAAALLLVWRLLCRGPLAASGLCVVERQRALALLGAVASPLRPAAAMWQVWQPSDMLAYVKEAEATPESVLLAMDRCASTSWMTNMGAEKGDLVEEAFKERRNVLEIDTFLGYTTIHLARSLAPGATLTTLEIDDANYDAATKLLDKAGVRQQRRGSVDVRHQRIEKEGTNGGLGVGLVACATKKLCRHGGEETIKLVAGDVVVAPADNNVVTSNSP